MKNLKKKTLFFLVFLVFFMAGCSKQSPTPAPLSSHSSSSPQPFDFSQLESENQENSKSPFFALITPGMTPDQVETLLGSPEEVQETSINQVHQNHWLYLEKELTVTFENTVVVSIQVNSPPTAIPMVPNDGSYIGLTQEGTLALLGEPYETTQNIVDDYIFETWLYENGFTVFFENGIVTQVKY